MYGTFYIPVNFAFNLSHYVTNAICTTQVKKRVKKRKKKKNKVMKNLLQGYSSPHPPNKSELKVNASIE